jgi:hypothetical protein
MEKVLEDYLNKLLNDYQEEEIVTLEQLTIDFIEEW